MEQRARVIAEQHDCLLIKLQHGIVGMPDRLFIAPHHPMRLIEFKREDEEPSPIQLFWHRQLGRGGHPVMVFDNIEQFRDLIDSLKLRR